MTTSRHGGLNLIGEPGMFDRYTDRARRAVVLADQAAARMLHDTVDTGHLLLGLIGEGGGVAFTALDALGVTTGAASVAVCRRRPAGDADPKARRPFTPQGKKALELALREALHLGHNYIATEHLLLGLIREGSDVGALALADCGIADGDQGFSSIVRAKVMELLRGYAKAERAKPVLSLEDGATVARLFASWAQQKGALSRATKADLADLAEAFAYGYACGAGKAAGEARAKVDLIELAPKTAG